MDFLDYREKLGIGCYDGEKFTFFLTKIFNFLLQAYTSFMNNYAKHRDATSNRLLEYLMYQTGNIIRLLITLKQGEDKQ